MNTTKRIPNPKNNQAQASPWLLCPSKRFPGNFYYFNGSTGETTWCLSDTNKNVKNGSIHRVTDESHSYPEPFDPPINDSTNTTYSFSSVKNTGNTDFTHTKTVRPSPVSGQAVFPKYVQPEMLTPRVVWVYRPMYVPSQMPQHWQTMNQTQVYEAEQPMFMPPSQMPFHNQFKPLRPIVMPGTFQYRNTTPVQTFKEAPMFDQSSNFNTCHMSQATQTVGKPLTKDKACQTFAPTSKLNHTQSESDSTTKIVDKSRPVENLTSLITSTETSTLNSLNKVENEINKLMKLGKNDLRFKLVAQRKNVETKNGKNKIMKLGKNDLRFKLVAKRKNLETSTEYKNRVKPSDQSNASERREDPAPKKRVTFDLQEPGTGVTSDGVQGPQQSPNSTLMEDPSQPISDTWYVVADSAVLLTELKHIDEFIQSDERCKLLIPHVVRSELEARARGDCGVVNARKLLRRLQSNDGSIIVQSKQDHELSPENSILQCCWDLLQEDCHVVLVTNTTNMLNKAKSIDLECYTIEEIKNCDATDPSPNMGLAKLKIIVDNDKKESDNLFVQDINKINDVSLTKPNGLSVSDVSIVNDQIVNSSIADTVNVKNITKQIVNNVFSNAGNNNKIDQNSIDISHRDNLNRSNQNLRKNTNLAIDQIDVNKTILNVKENNRDKPRDDIKVSGITKLKHHFNLDEELQRFCVKSAAMEHRVKIRLDEWSCRLNQVMEGVLTDILLKEGVKMKKMTPPWNLFEAIQVAGQTFKNQPNIKKVIDRFSMERLSCSSDNGKLHKDIKPNEFLKLVGYSMILLEHLKEVVDYTELKEAQDRLHDLIKNMKDPKTDIDLSLEEVNTPIFSRSDISDAHNLIGFRKSPSKNQVPDELHADLLNDLSVSESTADTVCPQAYRLAKAFLIKVKATLKQIFDFINKSLQEFEVMPQDKKADMLMKAKVTQESLLKITESLKTIIARESSKGITLKSLLIKAGDYERAHVAIVKYTATVTSFLELIPNLEKLLAHLLSLSNTSEKKLL